MPSGTPIGARTAAVPQGGMMTGGGKSTMGGRGKRGKRHMRRKRRGRRGGRY